MMSFNDLLISIAKAPYGRISKRRQANNDY